MILQGTDNSGYTPLEVPASLKNRQNDQGLILGVKEKVSDMAFSPEQKQSINNTLDKFSNGNDNIVLNETDKSNLSTVVDTYGNLPPANQTAGDQQSVDNLKDKLQESGNTKIGKSEKSFIMRILEAIASFFSKIFGGGHKENSAPVQKDYSYISPQANQMNQAGTSATTFPIADEEPHTEEGQGLSPLDNAAENTDNSDSGMPLSPLTGLNAYQDPNQDKVNSPALDAINNNLLSNGNKEMGFDDYLNMAKAKGDKIDLSPNKKNIITIRTPTNPKANGGKGVYDDKTAVLWVDDKGNKHIKTFVSNADPSSQYAGKGYPKNSGRIKEGSYMYQPDGQGRLAPIGGVEVERFIGNKFVDTNEVKNDFLIHSGANNNTGSAGCQTMPPEVYQDFMDTLKTNGKIGKVSYTIINMPGALSTANLA